MLLRQFVPRKEFPNCDSIVKSYFIGHHKAGLDKMKSLLGLVDLVVECRDYRVPLSSRNPLFERSLTGKERLIVYTKRDLGEYSLSDTVYFSIELFFQGDNWWLTKTLYNGVNQKRQSIMKKWHEPANILFANYRSTEDVRALLKYARGIARALDQIVGMRMMVVGMPNVGKSSLLNALRRVGVGKGKAAMTGAQPGVTRSIASSVIISDDPVVHLIDTPGVFVPFVPNSITMLKLALVGCVKDTIVDPIIVCDYLLFRLNLMDPSIYSEFTDPTNDIFGFLESVAHRIGRIVKGGKADIEGTALWVLSQYRAGNMGRFVLDDIDEEALKRSIEEERTQAISSNQAKKRIKAERLQRRKVDPNKG